MLSVMGRNSVDSGFRFGSGGRFLSGPANLGRSTPARYTNYANGLFSFVKRRVTPLTKREMQRRILRETPVTEPDTPPSAVSRGGLPPWAAGILRGAAVCTGLGLLFAWLGVYDTGQIPFAERVVYWTGLMIVGSSAAVAINPLVFDRWMQTSHPAAQIAVVACAISIPVTVGLIVIEYVSDGTLAEPGWWWTQFGYVLVVSVILTAGGWALDRLAQKKVTPAAPQANATPTTPPLFTDRLPAKFRTSEIFAVSAEDHYLRVHTSAGETMILMRLADAIRELAALEGMQTHRSWWVAKQGLAETAKGDGRVTLKLKSGAEAPVSRTYQKAVKDAGWL
jgi:hypothetical protein